MPLPVLAAAGIMGALKGLGSLFGHHQKEKEAEQRYQERLRGFNAWTQGDRTRRALIMGLAKAHGVEKLIPPELLASFGNPTYTAPTKEYTPSAMGTFASNAFGGGADYLSQPGNPADLMHRGVSAGLAPGADPFSSEGDFGAGSIASKLGAPTVTGADSPLGSTGFGNFGTGPTFGEKDKSSIFG